MESLNNNMLMIPNFTYLSPAIKHLNFMILKTASFLYSSGFPIMVCPWILKKSNAVLFGTYQSAKSRFNISNINVAGMSVAPSDKVKLLGVMLGCHLMLDSHIMQVCRLSHIPQRSATSEMSFSMRWWSRLQNSYQNLDIPICSASVVEHFASRYYRIALSEQLP